MEMKDGQNKWLVGIVLLPLVVAACFGIYFVWWHWTAGELDKAIISAIAAGVGGLFASGIIWGVLDWYKRKQLRKKYAREPWRLRKDWAEGKATEHGRNLIWFMLPFSIVANVGIWMAVVYGTSDSEKISVKVGTYLGPVLGLVLLIFSFQLLRHRLKYGVTKLILGSVPIPLGSVLKGRIMLPPGCGHFLKEFEVTLSCVMTPDADRPNVTQTLSKDVKTVRSVEEGSIPVEFDIPLGVDPTREDPTTPKGISWNILVSGPLPDKSFTAEYEVPIYKTDLSSEQRAVAEAKEDAMYDRFVKEIKDAPLPAGPGVEIRSLPDGKTEFHFKANPSPKLSLTLLGLTLLFLSPTVLALIHPTGLTLFAAILCGVISLRLGYSTTLLFFEEYQTTIDPEAVRVRWRLLCFHSEKVIPIQSIKQPKMQHSGGPFYSLWIWRQDGRRVRIGSMVRGMNSAIYLVLEMARILKIEIPRHGRRD